MKKILSLVLTLSLLVSMCVFTGVSVSAEGEQWNGQAATSFSGGDGSKETPYQIGTAGELKLFANIVNGQGGQTQKTDACGTLTADIVLNVGDVSGCDGTKADGWYVWFPIGYWYDTDGDGSNEDFYYTGTFNGNGHTVSGLYFNNTNQSYIGLFGQVDSNAEISNLGIVNSYIKGKNRVTGVCGYNKGTITGCYNTGTVNGSKYVGGVCGSNNNGTITGCYNTGVVSGAGDDVGGVCGWNQATITDCYNTGTISGSSNVGGVCGWNQNTITGCYNTGAVSGSYEVGGVCGSNNNGTITGCYNTGNVSGDTDDADDLGGVCGINYGTIIGCYNTGSISGEAVMVGGVCGYSGDGGTYVTTNCYYLKDTAQGGIGGGDIDGSAESKTAEFMKSQEFVDLLNQNEGVNFVLGENGYPVQAWQIPPEPEYTVTIPSEVSLGQPCPVSVDVTILPTGMQVAVTLTGTSGADNAFTMQTADGASLTYTVSNSGNPVTMGDKILAASGAGSKSANLVFHAPETVQYAGTYTGTVTFTVSVADAD